VLRLDFLQVTNCQFQNIRFFYFGRSIALQLSKVQIIAESIALQKKMFLKTFLFKLLDSIKIRFRLFKESLIRALLFFSINGLRT